MVSFTTFMRDRETYLVTRGSGRGVRGEVAASDRHRTSAVASGVRGRGRGFLVNLGNLDLTAPVSDCSAIPVETIQ